MAEEQELTLAKKMARRYLHGIDDLTDDAAWEVASSILRQNMVENARLAIEYMSARRVPAVEAEPVAWRWRYPNTAWETVFERKAWFDDGDERLIVEPLYTAPPPAWKPPREAVARIIEPWAWGIIANIEHTERAADDRAKALKKADAILALQPEQAG